MTTVSLRHLRLRPGEEHDEIVEVPIEPFVLGGQTYAADPAVAPFGLVVQRAASGDVFRITGDAALVGPCMRCLEEARVAVTVEAREYQDAASDAPAELRSDYVADGELHVGAWVRDQVALLVPEQVLCRPDCAGLCPICGDNLNDRPHVHDEVTVDPRWAALEDLKLDD